MRRTYRGSDIDVSYDYDVCIHVGACLRGSPWVFDLDRRPWILPDAADADTVAAVVERCPSGALQYRRHDGRDDEQRPTPTSIVPSRDGPLLVHGDLEVMRADGVVETPPRATLCRCGRSGNKPFCDNSHLDVGFTADGQPLRVPTSAVRPDGDRPIDRHADPRRTDDT